MHHKDLLKLRILSYEYRKDILSMLSNAGSGHTGGSLSVVDLLLVLYNKILSHKPKKPNWENRDRVILSAGHLCPALYVTLANNGYFDKSKLLTLRKSDSGLQGHPEFGMLSGIENTSGPLGQGLSVACGIALSNKLKGSSSKTFCVASDGEHQEGAVWEAAQFAAQNKLNNLCLIIDRNNIQIGGDTEKQVALRSLKDKYKSFGWQVYEINGNNLRIIFDVLNHFLNHKQKKPFCIVAHTTLGKGIGFMENDPSWHGKVPNKKELDSAFVLLDNKINELKIKHSLYNRGVLK